MQMSEQEWITDLILTEKKMSSNYDTFASECVNDRLRDTYMKIFTQGHETQTNLFKAAQKRGWYQVEAAPESKVSTAYTKFCNVMPK